MSETTSTSTELTALTARIVAAHVAHTPAAPSDLPELIRVVAGALARLGAPEPTTAAPAREPAVPIRRSVTPDFIVCLEDGKKLKMLKRHLSTVYGMTPDDYRAKWNLPSEYPMVAPNYARARSDMAMRLGLGRKRV